MPQMKSAISQNPYKDPLEMLGFRLPHPLPQLDQPQTHAPEPVWALCPYGGGMLGGGCMQPVLISAHLFRAQVLEIKTEGSQLMQSQKRPLGGTAVPSPCPVLSVAGSGWCFGSPQPRLTLLPKKAVA